MEEHKIVAHATPDYVKIYKQGFTWTTGDNNKKFHRELLYLGCGRTTSCGEKPPSEKQNNMIVTMLPI